MKTEYYLNEIAKERTRQDEKWGEQDHHPLMWFSIIGEEYGKMLRAFNKYSCEEDPNYYDEMQSKAINAAASCVAMLECIDRMAEKNMVPERGM